MTTNRTNSIDPAEYGEALDPIPERLPHPVEVEAGEYGVRPCKRFSCRGWLLAVAQEAGPDLLCPRCGQEATA